MDRIPKSELSNYIWNIMKAGDLNTLTAKKIRDLCEANFKVDLSDRKSEIDDILVAYVMKYCDDVKAGKEHKVVKAKCDEGSAASSGSSSGSESDSESRSSDSESSDEESVKKTAPAPKKTKKTEALGKTENVPAKKVSTAAKKRKNQVPAKNNAAAKKKKNQPAVPVKSIVSAAAKKEKDQLAMDEALARKIQAQERGLREKTAQIRFCNTMERAKQKRKG